MVTVGYRETFSDARHVCTDRSIPEKVRQSLRHHTLVEADINSLPFGDNEFECVMARSAFEHDKYFWRSLSEVRRVLKKKMFVVGVPIYMKLETDYLIHR